MAKEVKSMLTKDDEKNIKRLLALEMFGEKAIRKAEKNAKQIYEIVVNGKKVKKELILSNGALLDMDGNVVFALKPQFLT